MNMVLGHKGKVSFRVSIGGLACHSAYISNGVNAVEYAAELIAFIRAMNQRVQQQMTDPSYSVPHSTFHVGNISGGTALNIVPQHCEFEFEIRNLPQQDLDALVHEIKHYANDVLLTDMRSRHPDSAIRFDEISSYPGLHTDPASAVIAYTRNINPIDQIGENVSFGTEAGLFDDIGINCVVCGPGSIDQAHKPDEFVSREQIQTCDRMIENLVHRCRETAEFG
jgi:acetylornithine deacetylase